MIAAVLSISLLSVSFSAAADFSVPSTKPETAYEIFTEASNTFVDNTFIKEADVQIMNDGVILTNTVENVNCRTGVNSEYTSKTQSAVRLVLESTSDAEIVTENIERVKQDQKVVVSVEDLLDPVPVMTRSGGSQYKYAEGAYSCTLESTVSYVDTTVNGKPAVYLTGVSGGVKNLPVGATGNGGYVRIGQTGTGQYGYKEQITTKNLDKYNRTFIVPIPSSWVPVYTGTYTATVGAYYYWTVISGSTVKSISLSNNIYGSV